MKVRIKFQKSGVMKFIGHLDVMRYFQKALRRAEIPVAFTGGFSPHMVMSFASPLGVGLTSDGEYFDLELTEEISSAEIIRRLNETMVDGMKITDAVQIPDTKKDTGMAIVAAADYLVYSGGEAFSKEQITEFLVQPEILIEKETKKSKKVVNIRPLIYQMELRGDALYILAAAGSKENLKPSLVMEAYYEWLKKADAMPPLSYHRLELYADVSGGAGEDDRLVPLCELGTVME